MSKLLTCSKCAKEYDITQSPYYCGYDKCATCCLGCMHRNYPNPKYKPNKKTKEGDRVANALNKAKLDDFFGRLNKAIEL